MRGFCNVLSCAVVALLGPTQSIHAQPVPPPIPVPVGSPAFQRLFDPRTALTITLEMKEADWNAIAGAQPRGGFCIFAFDPTIDRYDWHKTDATLVMDGPTSTQQTYAQIGIKKRSFCGSMDSQKPSLTLNFVKNLKDNRTKALDQLGTVTLSLGNAKQERHLFGQSAAYYVFRKMDVPAPMCTFTAVYRRDGKADPVFLGLYVLIEAMKEDFFTRRPAIQNVPKGSLYELENPDDFTPDIMSNKQLQVDWSATKTLDFQFAIDQMQKSPATALEKTLDLPSFIRLWATEIALKHLDGYTNNLNNTYVFDDPPANPQAPITKTRFRFVPHGTDQVLLEDQKMSVYRTSITAKLAYKDDGLRYQLISTLAGMGTRLRDTMVADYVNTTLPLVMKLWRAPDKLIGNPSDAPQKAEKMRKAIEQAVVELWNGFGYGMGTPPSNQTVRLAGPNTDCVTRLLPAGVKAEVSRAVCTNQPGQKWVFEAAPFLMMNQGFAYPPLLYRVRNQGSSDCLTATAELKLEMNACNSTPDKRQWFYLVERDRTRFELRAYAEDKCAHFTDPVLTADGRPAIQLSDCTGKSENLFTYDAQP